MPSSHLAFIPSVFAVGLMSGLVLSSYFNARGADSKQSFRRYKLRGVQLLSALGLFLSIFVATHVLPLPNGANSLHVALGHKDLFDQSPAASAAEVYSRLESFGEVGRQAYQQFTYSGDAIFPLSFWFFLWLYARFVSERANLTRQHARLLVTLPVVWLLADLSENAIIFLLTSDYPARHDHFAAVLGVVTRTKFVLLMAALMAPSILMARFWLRGLR